MTDTKTETKKKRARNTKIYPVREILEKYNLTPQEFQDLAQEVLKPSHIATDGLTNIGVMMIGKAVKKLQRADTAKAKKKVEKVKEAEAESPNIRNLQVCGFRPPNKLRLWCIDNIMVDGEKKQEKVVVIVTRKIHEGAKVGAPLLCERIEEGLFRHPPLERD